MLLRRWRPGGHRRFHLLKHESQEIALFGKAKDVGIQVRNIYEKDASYRSFR